MQNFCNSRPGFDMALKIFLSTSTLETWAYSQFMNSNQHNTNQINTMGRAAPAYGKTTLEQIQDSDRYHRKIPLDVCILNHVDFRRSSNESHPWLYPLKMEKQLAQKICEDMVERNIAIFTVEFTNPTVMEILKDKKVTLMDQGSIMDIDKYQIANPN